MADPGGESLEREVRNSIMQIEKQRTRKLWRMMIGLTLALIALAVATLLAYNEEPDAAKGVTEEGK